jgi:hypothetical protein
MPTTESFSHVYLSTSAEPILLSLSPPSPPHLILFPPLPTTHVPARPPRPFLLKSASHRSPHSRTQPPPPPRARSSIPPSPSPSWGWRYRVTGCSSSRPSHAARSTGAPCNEDLAPPCTPYPHSASGRADSGPIPFPPL